MAPFAVYAAATAKLLCILTQGSYRVTPEAAQVATPPQVQSELNLQAKEQPRVSLIAASNSLELQTKLSERAYPSLVSAGLGQYSKDNYGVTKLLADGLEQVKSGEAARQEVVYFYRRTAFLQQGNFINARVDYDQVTAIEPDDAEAFYNRGTTFLQQGKLVEAIKDFDRTIALNSDDAGAFSNRGNALYRQGKPVEAIKDYDQAIALKPDYLPAVTNIGLVNYESGEVDRARMHWQRAASLDGKAAEPRLALAVALYTQGDRMRGIALAEEALAIDKSYANLEYLKKNLWGKRLLADAAKLLAEL